VVPSDGSLPAPFEPAQVGMVGAFGIGEAAISISSPATETSFHEYTIRGVGAITNALTRLAPGDQLWVRGPFGKPWDLDLDGQDVIVAAGGIGVAPLRAAIYSLIKHRERYGQVALVVGARESNRLLYEPHFEQWREHGLVVIETIDKAEPGWDRRIGLVPDVVADVIDELGIEPARTSALLCGPDIMMRLIGERLIGQGVDPFEVQLTVERNMQCGNALCGHCQMDGVIVCRDGPVVRYPSVATALATPEL
jgi:NAD(P)H-flavin reductase